LLLVREIQILQLKLIDNY